MDSSGALLSTQTRESLQVDIWEGLPPAIDAVAGAAPAPMRFLRRQWYAAAIATYGGAPRTVLVRRCDVPVAALPMVPTGPAALGLWSVPGCYWPFRSFPVAEGSGEAVFAALLDGVAGVARALRIGPVYDGDCALEGLRAAARRWAAIDRFVAESFLLDMAALREQGTWPRNSTLRKNRFHEKHLAEAGALDWRFLSGAQWTDDAFDALAAIEAKSWISTRTDGHDAKFTAEGHGGFWRAAARDPVLAGMLWAAMLRIDGEPVAFSFDINAGALKYAIANSYDPRFAKHSPGKLLYYRNLVRALDDGITRVDWGAGDSGYKRVIGAQPGPAIRDWIFARPGLPALAARAMRGIWRRSGHRPPEQAETGAQNDGNA